MIDVTFSIISGTKQTLRLRDTTTVAEAKQTLSMITDSPPHTLTLLHKAKILNDNDKLSDLDFSSRNFIAVGIRRKSLMIQKHTGSIGNNEDETSPLKAIFGDSFATVRRHFLENPASVPILIAYIARSDPVNARLLTESPQILLRFLGISPEEFIIAINNMTQRFQQDQTNHQEQNNNANQNDQDQETSVDQAEQQNQQSDNSQDSQGQNQDKNVQHQDQQDQGIHQDRPPSLPDQDYPMHETQSSQDNKFDEQVSSTVNSESNMTDTSEQSNSVNATNNDIDIASFLATMTSEDLSNLEIVLSTNVSLEEAIPVFVRTGKNVDATINALRRTKST